jgi:hypothetical protein
VAEALDPAPAQGRRPRPRRRRPRQEGGGTEEGAGPRSGRQEGGGQEGGPKKAAPEKARAQEGPAGQEGAAKKAEIQMAPPPGGFKKAIRHPTAGGERTPRLHQLRGRLPVGSTIEGEVVSFTSHGAMVDVALPDGGLLHCYIPLSAMGDPAADQGA